MSGNKTYQETFLDLSVDFENTAIIITYDYEEFQLTRAGSSIPMGKKTKQKRINLSDINSRTNITKLSSEIMKSCKLIPHESGTQLEQLLFNLQHFVASKDKNVPSSPSTEATMELLDEYLEKMYDDDIVQKIQGTRAVSLLTSETYNIELLIHNESLLNAMSRVLQEEYKKSIELTTNIISIFRNFSHFSETHPHIIHYRVDSSILDVIDIELARYQLRIDELKQMEDDIRAKGTSLAMIKNKMTEINQEGFDKEKKRFKSWKKKHEVLLGFCLHTLLNLSEDIKLQHKYIKRNILKYLVQLLNRTNHELLIYILLYLRKLSTVYSNIVTLKELSIIEILAKNQFFTSNNTKILEILMRFLYNVSFDEEYRRQLLGHNFLSLVVDLLNKPEFRQVSIMVLYNLSRDDTTKNLFEQGEGIHIIYELVMQFPKPQLARELAGLLVNITWGSENVKIILKFKYLKGFLKRALKHQDSLLMKSIRNISQFTRDIQEHVPPAEYQYKGVWVKLIDPMLKSLKSNGILPDMSLEIIGTLSNLTALDLTEKIYWSDLVEEYDLINYICGQLTPGLSMDDLILDIVILIGQFLEDSLVGQLIVNNNNNLLLIIIELLNSKNNDNEIILQLLYAVYKLLLIPETRLNLLSPNSNLVHTICDFLNHNNPVVLKMSNKISELIINLDTQYGDGEKANIIRNRKFSIYNREWLEVVRNEQRINNDNAYDGENEMKTQYYRRPNGASDDRYIRDY